ncbi:MAG TPA: hypothetical protein VKU44_02630 [Terriglobia bacterium]|nr:hypothetical protein [Terriglobia bacterium]
MTVAQRTVGVILSDDGREVLRLAEYNLPDAGAALMYVQDVDDLGLWVRIQRADAEHVLLVRWEYVLSLDFPAGEAKPMGLRP